MGFPVGRGLPGWHIECSGISIKYLGEYLDIHCGGIDNAFPTTRTKLHRAKRISATRGANTGSTCCIF